MSSASISINEGVRYRKYATIEQAFKARLRGDRELTCMFWGRWKELMRVWNYMKSLRHELQRRTLLLDEVRDRYLKDVWAVKTAVDATQGQRKAPGGGDPLASTLAASSNGTPSLDLRRFGTVPSGHVEKFQELETRGYLALAGVGEASMRATEGYELLEEKTVPAYAPTECAFLAHHCTECQGVLALVYARNQRVSAALGLVSNYEELQASMREQLASIPGLEKQTRQLREQTVMLGSNLGTSELRASDLEDELRLLQKKYEEDMAELQKRHDEQEKVAAKVPGLEEKLSTVEERFAACESLSEERRVACERWEQSMEETNALMAANQGQATQELADRDTAILSLQGELKEQHEALNMTLEELRFERELTIPSMKAAEVESVKALEASEDARTSLSKELDDTKLKLQLALRRGDMMQQQLAEAASDLAAALKKPDVRHAEVQAAPATKDTATGFNWVEHLEPTVPHRIKIVSRAVVALTEAGPEIIAKQLHTTLGKHQEVQASAWGDEGPQDKEVQCVLKTPMEASLEGEVEAALDKLESVQEQMELEGKRHEATKVKLKLSELEVDDASQERDDALDLVDKIETQTRERLTSHWQSKFTMQGLVHKFMLNTQQKLTNELAGMMNDMKGRITKQSKFLGALTEGKTIEVKRRESKLLRRQSKASMRKVNSRTASSSRQLSESSSKNSSRGNTRPSSPTLSEAPLSAAAGLWKAASAKKESAFLDDVDDDPKPAPAPAAAAPAATPAPVPEEAAPAPQAVEAKAAAGPQPPSPTSPFSAKSFSSSDTKGSGEVKGSPVDEDREDLEDPEDEDDEEEEDDDEEDEEDEEEEEEEEDEKDEDVLEFGGQNGDTSTLDEDANALRRFGAVLEEKIDELTVKSKEADKEVATLRFLLTTTQGQIQTKNLELLKLKTRIVVVVDQFVESEAKNEQLEAIKAQLEARVKELEKALSSRTAERDEGRKLAAKRLRLIEEASVREASLRQELGTLQESYEKVGEQLNASLSIAAHKIDELGQERDLLLADKALLTQAVQDSYRTHCVEVKKVFLDNLKATRSVGTQLDCCVCAMRTPNSNQEAITNRIQAQPEAQSTLPQSTGGGGIRNQGLFLPSSSASISSSSASTFVLPGVKPRNGGNTHRNSSRMSVGSGVSGGGVGAKGAFRSGSGSGSVGSGIGGGCGLDPTGGDHKLRHKSKAPATTTIVVDKTGQRYPFATGTGSAKAVMSTVKHIDGSSLGVHLPRSTRLGGALGHGTLTVATHPTAPPYLRNDPAATGGGGAGQAQQGPSGPGLQSSAFFATHPPPPWAPTLPSEQHKRALLSAQSSTEGLSFDEAFEWSNQRVLLGALPVDGGPFGEPQEHSAAAGAGTGAVVLATSTAGATGGGGVGGRSGVAGAESVGRVGGALVAQVPSQVGVDIGVGGGRVGDDDDSSYRGSCGASSASSSSYAQEQEQQRLLQLLREERRKAELGVGGLRQQHNKSGGAGVRQHAGGGLDPHPVPGLLRRSGSKMDDLDELMPLGLTRSSSQSTDSRLSKQQQQQQQQQRGQFSPKPSAGEVESRGLLEPLSPLMVLIEGGGKGAGPGAAAGASAAGGRARPPLKRGTSDTESDIVGTFSFQPSFSSLSPPAPPSKSVSSDERAMASEEDGSAE